MVTAKAVTIILYRGKLQTQIDQNQQQNAMTVFSSNARECANCKKPSSGTYCSYCGQKSDIQRLEINTLFHNTFKVLIDFDSKIFRTIKELSFNPGQTALNYINGARISYINPLKYCITVFALALALAVMHLSGQIDDTVNRINTWNDARLEQSGATNKAALVQEHARQKAFVEVYAEYLQPMQFVMIPFSALLLQLLHYRKNRNYAEVTSFLCYIFGHAALIIIPLILLMSLTGFISYFSLWVHSAILLLLFGYGSKIFFELTWPAWFITTTISIVIYFALIGLVITGAADLRLSGVI